MRDITVHTKLIPLLGMPLEHSYSIQLQNRIFEHENLDYLRIPVEVGPDDVGDIVNAFRHMNIAGITATKPNKIEIMNYLDEIDPLAQSIGAVNCSILKDGKLVGYNTDGLGFLKSLEENYSGILEEANFFCFGAGGAGRAICVTLAAHGAKSIIINDCIEESAVYLAEYIAQKFPGTKTGAAIDEGSVRSAISNASVIMNVSGVGMHPHLDMTPADRTYFHSGQVVFDATYNPVKTKFLAEAEIAGCRVFNGKQMLAYCGMEGYRLLTGREAPKEVWMQLLDEIASDSVKSSGA